MTTIKRMKRPELIGLIESTIQNIDSIGSFVGDIENKKEALDSKYNNLVDEDDGVIKKINDSKKSAEENLGKILEYHKELFEGNEEDESINTQIEDLLNYYNESKEKINKFRKEIFGYKTKDETGEEKEIIGLKKKIEDFYSKQQEKYGVLFQQIEEELKGGATTIGLTKAFEDKVIEYKDGTKKSGK